jgi:hypothetical protein
MYEPKLAKIFLQRVVGFPLRTPTPSAIPRTAGAAFYSATAAGPNSVLKCMRVQAPCGRKCDSSGMHTSILNQFAVPVAKWDCTGGGVRLACPECGSLYAPDSWGR